MLQAHRRRQEQERALLGADYADEGLVFCTHEGRPLSRFNVLRDFKAALRRAGLAPIRFHDLRHTSASLLVTAGVNLKQAGARLGHANIQTTAKYGHLIPDLDSDAATRLERTIGLNAPGDTGTAERPTDQLAPDRESDPEQRGEQE